MSNDNVTSTRLDNGLQVVTRNVPGLKGQTPVAKITAGFLAGSRDEITHNHPHGGMHYLEHGFAYGSEKYSRPPQELIEEIPDYDAVLGQFNLVVQLSSTRCFARIPAAAAGYTMDVIGAMFSNPLLPPKELDIERDPIQIERIKNHLNFASMENILATYIGHGRHPRLHPIIGSEEGIDAVSTEVLHSILESHFLAGRTVVGVEGPVVHDEIVAAVQKSFTLPPGIRPASEVPVYTGGDARYPVNLPGTHLALAFKAPRAAELEQIAAFEVVQKFLLACNNKGAHSIYDALRRQGIIYNVNVGAQYMLDAGLITVAWETLAKPGFAERGIKTIQAVLAGLADHVDDASFERVLKAEKREHDRIGRCDLFGSDSLVDDTFLHGQVLPVQYKSGLRLNVTKDDIRRAAAEMIYDNPPTFLAACDISHVPSRDEVREIFGWRNAAPSQRLSPDKRTNADFEPAFA